MSRVTSVTCHVSQPAEECSHHGHLMVTLISANTTGADLISHSLPACTYQGQQSGPTQPRPLDIIGGHLTKNLNSVFILKFFSHQNF